MTSGFYTEDDISLNSIMRPKTELKENKLTFSNEELVLLEYTNESQ